MATEAFTNLSAEKRQRILDKGVEIFTKYSYGEASTNQITKELGISKGSLFYYFGSKKDFYLYLLETSIQLLLPQDQSIAATDFYGIVFEALHRKLRLYEGGRKEHILFVSRGAKETHEEVKAEKDALIGRYFVQAQQGSQAVLKRAIDTLDIENPEKTERLLTGMSLYVDAIINRYLAFYRDDPGALFQNEALVRSEISSRSNSASAAKMPNTSLPAGVVVSMEAPCPVSTLKPMPRCVRSCTVLMRWRRFRPSRSSFQTTRVSPSRSALSIAVRPGRSSSRPDAWSS